MPYKNKKSQREYHKQWYQKNKELRKKQIRKFQQKRKKEIIEMLFDYFEEHHCSDCGEKDKLFLEFDHLKNKKYNISQMINKGYSLDTVMKEIRKCEVVCANCHRKRTYNRLGSYRLDF